VAGSNPMNLNPLALALTLAVCNIGPAASANVSPKPYRSDSVLTVVGHGETAADQDDTDEIGKTLRHQFGFSFLVYRDKIQEELGLSADQKGELDKYLRQIAPDAMAYLQSNQPDQPAFQAYRTKAVDDLESVLKDTLSDAQRTRLGELVRQREGLFGGPTLWNGLEITEAEKAQFMALVEPMHQKMEAVAAEAQQGTDPIKFEHQVLGLRAELEQQMESVLTDSQLKRWKEMLGKPIDVDALFDLPKAQS